MKLIVAIMMWFYLVMIHPVLAVGFSTSLFVWAMGFVWMLGRLFLGGKSYEAANAIVLVALSLVLATAHERCSEITVNPCGIDLDDPVGSKHGQAAMKKSKLSEEQFRAQLKARTKFEWQRYGSLNACVSAMEAQDAITAKPNQRSYRDCCRSSWADCNAACGLQPGYVAPKPVDFGLLRL